MSKQDSNKTRMAARQFAVELTEEEMKEVSGGLAQITGTMCSDNGHGGTCCTDTQADLDV